MRRRRSKTDSPLTQRVASCPGFSVPESLQMMKKVKDQKKCKIKSQSKQTGHNNDTQQGNLRVKVNQISSDSLMKEIHEISECQKSNGPLNKRSSMNRKVSQRWKKRPRISLKETVPVICLIKEVAKSTPVVDLQNNYVKAEEATGSESAMHMQENDSCFWEGSEFSREQIGEINNCLSELPVNFSSDARSEKHVKTEQIQREDINSINVKFKSIQSQPEIIFSPSAITGTIERAFSSIESATEEPELPEKEICSVSVASDAGLESIMYTFASVPEKDATKNTLSQITGVPCNKNTCISKKHHETSNPEFIAGIDCPHTERLHSLRKNLNLKSIKRTAQTSGTNKLNNKQEKICRINLTKYKLPRLSKQKCSETHVTPSLGKDVIEKHKIFSLSNADSSTLPETQFSLPAHSVSHLSKKGRGQKLQPASSIYFETVCRRQQRATKKRCTKSSSTTVTHQLQSTVSLRRKIRASKRRQLYIRPPKIVEREKPVTVYTQRKQKKTCAKQSESSHIKQCVTTRSRLLEHACTRANQLQITPSDKIEVKNITCAKRLPSSKINPETSPCSYEVDHKSNTTVYDYTKKPGSTALLSQCCAQSAAAPAVTTKKDINRTSCRMPRKWNNEAAVITPPAEYITFSEMGEVEFNCTIIKGIHDLIDIGCTEIYLHFYKVTEHSSDKHKKIKLKVDLSSSPFKFIPVEPSINAACAECSVETCSDGELFVSQISTKSCDRKHKSSMKGKSFIKKHCQIDVVPEFSCNETGTIKAEISSETAPVGATDIPMEEHQPLLQSSQTAMSYPGTVTPYSYINSAEDLSSFEDVGSNNSQCITVAKSITSEAAPVVETETMASSLSETSTAVVSSHGLSTEAIISLTTLEQSSITKATKNSSASTVLNYIFNIKDAPLCQNTVKKNSDIQKIAGTRQQNHSLIVDQGLAADGSHSCLRGVQQKVSTIQGE